MLIVKIRATFGVSFSELISSEHSLSVEVVVDGQVWDAVVLLSASALIYLVQFTRAISSFIQNPSIFISDSSS